MVAHLCRELEWNFPVVGPRYGACSSASVFRCIGIVEVRSISRPLVASTEMNPSATSVTNCVKKLIPVILPVLTFGHHWSAKVSEFVIEIQQ